MKPAWDKLMKNTNKPNIVVADVDCTAAGKPLCDANGVQGFPTIKHGDPNNLEDYQGGRDYDSLKSFTDELKPVCSPSNLDLCDDDDRAKIEEIMAMDSDALNAAIEEKEQAINDAEKTFEDELERLQNTYKEISEAKDEVIAEVKKSGLGLMKAVKASAKSKSEL